MSGAIITTVSWIASLGDAGIKSDLTGLTASGALSYAGALQILQDVANRGSVSATEFADLQTIAGNLENGISTSPYVSSIFYQLVDGSPANADYTGGKTSDSGGVISLGNLKAGTTSGQLSELIGKWFLGNDMPDPTIPADGTQVPNAIYPTYTAYNYALFGSAGAPQIADIAQGAVGDCELCSGMIETLLNHPGLINSMFVDNGNGVYGVRFYVNGTETWVTVNDQLPTYKGGLVFNNAYVADPTQGLWADLLEKAYAQLSATGHIDHPAVNSYNNVSADSAFDVLTNLTDCSGVQYLDSWSPNWNAYKNIVIDAINQHDDVILETGNNVTGTFDASGNQMLVSNHAYAVMGYDSATGDFIVRNPWGVEYGSQGYITQFEVSMSDIASSAVQGDFVIDNSAAPNVVFTAAQLMAGLADQTYTSFRSAVPTMGAHLTVQMAPLFQTQDMAGQAVSQYRLQLIGSGASINLNGAADLASSAQQAAGQIVVSAADLSKLTLTTGAAGSDLELFISGNDGTGMSTPIEMYWSVDSQGLTVLPAANPMAAPSAALSLASLIQLAGTPNGSVTYTISMDAGLGTFNLNGAANLLSGSSTRIEVSAADLAKVTYTAPATAGIAVLDVAASTGSQTSDTTQIPIDVGYSVAAALLDFKQGTVPFQIGIADSAANIFAHLDSLQSMMPNWNLLGVLVDDTVKQTETISLGQFSADAGVLSILSGNYALDVGGVTVTQAQSLLGDSGNHLAGVQIADTAADIFANLGALESMAVAGRIAGITLTDAGSVAETITTAQLSADSTVLNAISSAYSLSVSGSAATVIGDLSTLQALAAKGALGSVTLTDSSLPTLSVTAAQFTADAAALNDITSAHAVTVQMTGTAAAHSFTGENWAGANALQFSDQTVIVAATPGGANNVSTGNVTELYSAVLAREPDVGGLAFYQNFLKSNPATPLQTFADFFLNSTEYSSAHSYAQTTAGETQFITDSYQNLLHRAPTASDITFYLTNVLEKPGTQLENHALMLVYFSASSEFLGDVQITAQNPASAQHWLLLT